MRLEPKPNRLSPVHEQHQALGARISHQEDWLVPEIYTNATEEGGVLRENVGLTDISARGKLIIRGDLAGKILSIYLGEEPSKTGDVIQDPSNQLVAACLVQDEFLILTPPGGEQKIKTAIKAEIAAQNTFVSIFDQTSGLVGLSISGPKGAAVMRKLCAVPFNSNDIPNLHAVQSSFAKVHGTIIRHDQVNFPVYELYADRPYGEYLWETILDAGREFGMQPVGWAAAGNLFIS